VGRERVVVTPWVIQVRRSLDEEHKGREYHAPTLITLELIKIQRQIGPRWVLKRMLFNGFSNTRKSYKTKRSS